MTADFPRRKKVIASAEVDDETRKNAAEETKQIVKKAGKKPAVPQGGYLNYLTGGAAAKNKKRQREAEEEAAALADEDEDEEEATKNADGTSTKNTSKGRPKGGKVSGEKVEDIMAYKNSIWTQAVGNL